MDPRRPRTWLLRRVLVLLAAAVALAAGSGRAAADDDEPAAKACRCEQANACYHFLRSPVPAPEDACPCPKCTESSPHDGQTVPDGWNRDCWTSSSLDCFLRRQAASWRFVCTECEANVACCKRTNSARCPACQEGDAKDPMPRDHAATAKERLAIEKRVFPRSKPIAVVSRHAYVVTDAAKIKLRTQSGSFRWATGHELAHLVAVRAEVAYREFSARVGLPALSRPVGIFVPQSEATARELQAVYFRNPESHMVYSSYGGSSASAISDGFCLNGFCTSLERIGDDDRALHQAVRHLYANVAFTNWQVQSGEERTTPPWAFEGIAHWFGKLPEACADEVYYCEGEDNRVGGSGKKWAAAAADMAKKGQFRAAEPILANRALGKLQYRDLVQIWSWFHVAMEDCPKKWVEVLAAVRREKDVHEAIRQSFGFSAAEFQARVVARLAGTKRNMLDGGADGAAAAPAADTDPAVRAARIRAAPPPADRAAALPVVDALASGDDLLRETAFAALLRAAAPEARDAIRTAGLAHADPVARAYAARLCRFHRTPEARDALRKLLDDPHWLVRSEAALAALAIRDWDAQARVRAMLADASPKARIAATDALRSLGKDANPACVPALLPNLDHADWQVRIATAQGLSALGDARAVGPLVDRLATEGGRVAEEYLAALRAITGDDLGRNPDAWKKWWEKVGPEVATTGFPKPVQRPPDPRYAPPPKSYGIEIASWRVGFVVDLSRSTNRAFTASAEHAAMFLGGETQGTIQSLFRGSLVRTMRGFDSRTKFNVWCFHTSVSRWEGALRPATAANVDAAETFLRARTPDGETDFHRALRAALDVPEGDAYLAGFRETPDTIWLLTDGTPTDGALTDPDMLLRWYGEVNRYARIRTHTVAFGALGVDERLLGALASQNGGTFVQVGEHHPR